ncbi:hypothetical protein K4F52_007457 [Lecanicillium sp. MT-2017a]|nr:hypothetical protein K4F52_007457 [Lecanicillium sp. MT-2017a]
MVSEGTLALLSACKFLLRGTELAIARDQIRLTIGCLRAIGETWPRTARNVSEIQIIARHVLGIDSQDGYGDASSSDKSSVPSSESGPAASESGNSSLNSDVFSSIQDIGDLCGWYNLDEMNSGLSWWATGT